MSEVLAGPQAMEASNEPHAGGDDERVQQATSRTDATRSRRSRTGRRPWGTITSSMGIDRTDGPRPKLSGLAGLRSGRLTAASIVPEPGTRTAAMWSSASKVSAAVTGAQPQRCR